MLLDVRIFAVHVRLHVVWMFLCQPSLQFAVCARFHGVGNHVIAERKVALDLRTVCLERVHLERPDTPALFLRK